VRIMSLHKSKGLISPVVVIAGCIEGLLPAAPDPDKSPQEQQADLEEQRRLLYVGLTRVKAVPESNQPGVLLLTYSRSMTLADAMQSGIRGPRASVTQTPSSTPAASFVSSDRVLPHHVRGNWSEAFQPSLSGD